MARLITKEDKYHVHKILGVFTLLNFITRIIWYIFYKTMFLYPTPISIICILGHLMLSSSSLIFHISSYKNTTAPMIWPEFRLHSILFAYRSILSMLICLAYVHSNKNSLILLLNPILIIGVLKLADLITSHYKPEGTTMRTMPMGSLQPYRSKIDLFYSTSQMLATLTILYSTNVEQGFLILLPIQLAAFLMTLVRKNFITGNTWHLIYIICLLMSWVYNPYNRFFGLNTSKNNINALIYWISAISVCIARFIFHINKYVIWCIICIVQIYLTQIPPN